MTEIMTEMQKNLIKEAVEQATKAWTALGEAVEAMKTAHESMGLDCNKTAVTLLTCEDAFQVLRNNAELGIASLERLARG